MHKGQISQWMSIQIRRSKRRSSMLLSRSYQLRLMRKTWIRMEVRQRKMQVWMMQIQHRRGSWHLKRRSIRRQKTSFSQLILAIITTLNLCWYRRLQLCYLNSHQRWWMRRKDSQSSKIIQLHHQYREFKHYLKVEINHRWAYLMLSLSILAKARKLAGETGKKAKQTWITKKQWINSLSNFKHKRMKAIMVKDKIRNQNIQTKTKTIHDSKAAKPAKSCNCNRRTNRVKLIKTKATRNKATNRPNKRKYFKRKQTKRKSQRKKPKSNSINKSPKVIRSKTIRTCTRRKCLPQLLTPPIKKKALSLLRLYRLTLRLPFSSLRLPLQSQRRRTRWQVSNRINKRQVSFKM